MNREFLVGEWLVRPDLNSIEKEGEERSIEPKVMDVLLFFSEHPGEVLSRERIIQAVWADTFVTDDALKYAIVTLRKVLGDNSRDPLFIRTIPRRGYQLISPVKDVSRSPSDRYQVKQRIGRGAMGEVYLGEDGLLKRKVALKFLRGDGEQDEAARHRLLREARAAAALDHPYICKIYDTGDYEGRTFIAMEYVEGRTLRERLAEGTLTTRQAMRISREVAEALEMAAERGIVHRDIKPSNIMLTRQGHVKVTDFGVAKRLSPPATGEQTDWTATLTEEISTRGTLPYMSPEQIRAQEVDQRSDIFSFGVVLYEMLTGINLFQRPSPIETANAILSKQLPSVSHPDAPGILEYVTERMLAKDPRSRCPTAGQLRADLAELAKSATLRKPSSSAPFRLFGAPSRTTAGLAAVSLVVLSLLAWWLLKTPVAPFSGPLQVTPFTSYPGDERDPSFSPDGSQIAFTWNGPGGDNDDIYVKVVGGEGQRRLTFDENKDFSPAWSPDGRSIAFVRLYEGGEVDILSVPPTGGMEIKLGESFRDAFRWTGIGRWLSWYPDSKSLAVSLATPSEPLSFIARLPLGGGEIEKLSAPPDGCLDFDPAISPDGKTLAFARCSKSSVLAGTSTNAGIYTMPSRGGAEKLLTTGSFFYEGLAWTPDCKHLVYTDGFPLLRQHELYIIPASGGSPELILAESGAESAVSRQGNSLAFARLLREIDIWEIQLPRSGDETLRRTRHPVSSTQPEMDVDLSPDGKRIVFVSEKPGGRQVFVADRDGGNLTQLTSMYHTYRPRWSPDGKKIVFGASTRRGASDCYLIGADRSGLRRVARGGIPSWSADGKWIYFCSALRDESQIWRVPSDAVEAGGAQAELVTRNGGTQPLESPDGEFLYYRKPYYFTDRGPERVGIWRLPLKGGEEMQIVDQKVDDWIVGRQGVYYIYSRGSTPVLEMIDSRSGEVRKIAEMEGDCFSPAVSPDGFSILYCKWERGQRDIMLAENLP